MSLIINSINFCRVSQCEPNAYSWCLAYGRSLLALMMMASLIMFSSLHLGFLAFHSLKQHLGISPQGLDLRHPLKTRSPRKCYWRCGPSKRWSLVEGSLVIREHFREHLNPAPSFGFSFLATASWEASSVTHPDVVLQAITCPKQWGQAAMNWGFWSHELPWTFPLLRLFTVTLS